MMDTQAELERIRARYEQRRDAFKRQHELDGISTERVWTQVEHKEFWDLEWQLKASDWSHEDIEALLRIIDQQRDVIAAARQMAGTYLWQDEAAAKAQYHLRGMLREYDALAAGDGG